MVAILPVHSPGNRSLTIEHLWAEVGFQPNAAQRAAILHVNGPLYLPAGPGSGKTRVLLWRTLNLVVFHGVPPEAIYLSTFTEKAARQLKEGLRALLGLASLFTGQPYDCLDRALSDEAKVRLEDGRRVKVI
ncbi:MAG: UvrD-helicase domain-containing protein [Caldilineales bacterium]|nr:UvrD-helicase domain-containing protein [Caldilineales bacterium]MDW8318422.1 UvrD-helicase domain-containing protein [Anaerolineae bacterium]